MAIDRLDIELTASVDDAVNKLRTFASALGNLSKSSAPAAEKLKALKSDTRSVSSTIEKTTKATSNFIDKLKALGQTAGSRVVSSFKKAAEGVNGFFEKIKRVAMYRLIRSALRMITEGFKEGIVNFRAWSEQHGGKFAKTMDELGKSVNYLKNALGTLAAPLIEAVAPAINAIIDLLVNMINAFNMAIAALNGQDTYTVAVRATTAVSNAMSEVAEGVKNASDDIKRTILGFDEINKLAKETTGGGGGGGGGGGFGGLDGGGGFTFEERPLEGVWKTISDITDGMPEWLRWLLTGTALVGGFLLIKNFIPWVLEKLKELFTLKIPDWLRWLFGGGRDGDDGDGDIKKDVTIDLHRGSNWDVLDDLNDKSVDIIANVEKGNWNDDAWNAANMTSYSPTRSVISDVKKGAWNNDAWNAANMTSYTAIRTVTANVNKGSWDSDAWNAANMTSYNPHRSVTVNVSKGAWNNDAWNAANMTSYNATRTITSAVKKGDWDRDAWNASNMTSYNATRAITAIAKKGEWDKDAWNASNMTSFSATRTITSAVKKGQWDSDAWIASNMTSYSANRTITAAIKKGAWDNDAWNAANMTSYTATRTIIANVKKGDWDNDAWNAVKQISGTVEKTLSVNVNRKTDGDNSSDNTLWKIITDPSYFDRKIYELPIGLNKKGWTTVEDYVDENFGGATGGGGGTLGGGAGRKGRSISVGIELTNEGTNWGSTKGGVTGWFGKRAVDLVANLKRTNSNWGDAKGGVTGWFGKRAVDLVANLKRTNSNWGSTKGGVTGWFGKRAVDLAANLTNKGANWEGGAQTWLKTKTKGVNLKTNLTNANSNWNKDNGGAQGWLSKVVGGGGVNLKTNLTNSGTNWNDGILKYITGNKDGDVLIKVDITSKNLMDLRNDLQRLSGKNGNSATITANDMMYAAVNSVMNGATLSANISNGGYSYNAAGDGMEAIVELMRRDSEEMRRQNDLLRQQNDLLRQINNKESGGEISTRSILKAQQYTNRRAGTTVVAIGG